MVNLIEIVKSIFRIRKAKSIIEQAKSKDDKSLALSHLNLTSEDLKKLLPIIIKKIPDLESLDLGYNKLTDLSKEILKLTNLSEIVLSDNDFNPRTNTPQTKEIAIALFKMAFDNLHPYKKSDDYKQQVKAMMANDHKRQESNEENKQKGQKLEKGHPNNNTTKKESTSLKSVRENFSKNFQASKSKEISSKSSRPSL